VSKHGKEQAAKNKESLRQNAETKVSAHAAHIPTETQQSSLLSPVAPSCDYPATSCVYS
jgi:hypothetical protein